MAQVYLTIGDLDSLLSFLEEAKEKTGMLKDISLLDVKQSLSDKDFPMQIPVNLDGVLKLCGNPMLKKMFGKKVENTTRKYLKAAMSAT